MFNNLTLTLSELLQTISKVAKQMVFRITPTQIIFVLSEKEVKANGVTSWCEFAADKLFSEYIMEGHSAQENEIYLEISLGKGWIDKHNRCN